MAELTAFREAVDEGIRRGLHTGVQVCVLLDGREYFDGAFGEAEPGRGLTSAHLMPWRSAGKPLTALLVLKELHSRGIPLSTPLASLLPESIGTDKSTCSLHSLLTHTSGFPQVDTGWPHVGWEESVRRVLQEPCGLPYGSAAYHPQSSWFLLGELLCRFAGGRLSFAELLQRDLLEPLGLTDVYCGIPAEQLSRLQERLPWLYERDRGQLISSTWATPSWLTRSSPGGNLRGPVRQLARFMQLLLNDGDDAAGRRFVSAEVVRAMTARQRAGAYDQTLQHVVDFGLGVICNSNAWGAETLPYGLGRWSSVGSFGHGGSQCSLAMCDPERGLAVAWAANGFCGEGQHQRRNRLFQDALYRDLGFAHE
ncbi:MAG: serine hydrolase domain-containing protein [Planctomycetota bacterium]